MTREKAARSANAPARGTRYAEVILSRKVDKVFDYRVSTDLGPLEVGHFVRVPFGREKKLQNGVVVGLKSKPDVAESALKDVHDILQDVPPLSASLLSLAAWMGTYYGAAQGLVLKPFIPPGVLKGIRPRVAGKVKISPPEARLTMNPDQQAAIRAVETVLGERRHQTFLLWGVTGSGKTEVYFHLMDRVLAGGQSVILIVPEIALTAQLTERCRRFFAGREVILMHSRLTPGERAAAWRSAASGAPVIALGVRSAVFAPMKNLGLIVVDEEHERTFKQEESPRYHARDVAVLRGSLEQFPVVLGSATPSLESMKNCQSGKYTLLSMPARVSPHPAATMIAVDMAAERRRMGRLSVFSETLLARIQDRMKRREQVILFLNRRGFSRCLVCRSCGRSVQCPQCSVSMTLHRTQKRLLCHRCDAVRPEVARCPDCGRSPMKPVGFGTERMDTLIRRLFPEARVGRLDSDTMRVRGHLDKIWDAFKMGRLDILIGTQMVAKGLDNANVTLVGILAADLALNIPDFRAGESTFQLITQVAGRAGRGDKAGEVVVQFESGRHPVIVQALAQDAASFYRDELAARKQLGYPPFRNFLLLEVTHTREQRLQEMAAALAVRVRKALSGTGNTVRGPVPAPLARLRGKYRFHLYVVTGQVRSTVHLLLPILKESPYATHVSLDVDPVSVL